MLSQNSHGSIVIGARTCARISSFALNSLLASLSHGTHRHSDATIRALGSSTSKRRAFMVILWAAYVLPEPVRPHRKTLSSLLTVTAEAACGIPQCSLGVFLGGVWPLHDGEERLGG